MSLVIVFFKQKTAYEMRISDWSSDVCSSELSQENEEAHALLPRPRRPIAPRRRIEDEQAEAGDPGEDGDQFPRDALDRGRDGDHCGTPGRSEERRVGKEWVSTCRSRWSPVL